MEFWNLIIAGVVAFVITAALGPFVIPALRKLKFGQSILEEGPSWHKSKQGTPTMGGVLFIIGIVVAFLICGYSYYSSGDIKALAALLLAVAFGLIGFCDDFIKVKMKRNLGLTAWQKIVLQVLASAGFLIFLAVKGGLSTKFLVPFTSITVDLGMGFYVLAMLLIVGMVNAANLTDGIDGLDASVTVPIAAFFMVAGIRAAGVDNGVSVLSAALIGGMLGFLVHNFHPAKVFMGDTGSLFIGGLTVGLAFSLNMPFVILLAGIIYLVEACSVMIQVLVYKLTKKRVFKMAPIHHHFEMSGWNEVKIVYVFTVVSLIACILAYLATGSVTVK
jgi:phospho-N-acetylmuramoyl-pentapeptide-transferase